MPALGHNDDAELLALEAEIMRLHDQIDSTHWTPQSNHSKTSSTPPREKKVGRLAGEAWPRPGNSVNSRGHSDAIKKTGDLELHADRLFERMRQILARTQARGSGRPLLLLSTN
jgi:hypothetical protein